MKRRVKLYLLQNIIFCCLFKCFKTQNEGIPLFNVYSLLDLIPQPFQVLTLISRFLTYAYKLVILIVNVKTNTYFQNDFYHYCPILLLCQILYWPWGTHLSLCKEMTASWKIFWRTRMRRVQKCSLSKEHKRWQSRQGEKIQDSEQEMCNCQSFLFLLATTKLYTKNYLFFHKKVLIKIINSCKLITEAKKPL